MDFNDPQACWDSESRQSPYSTVADPNEDDYCEGCDSTVDYSDGSKHGKCKCDAETAEPVVSFIGGRMYGDGEFVIDFHVSEHSPLSATVLGPGPITSLTFEKGVKPNIDTARRAIALVRLQS